MSGEPVFLGLPGLSATVETAPTGPISAAQLGVHEIDLNVTSTCNLSDSCRICYHHQEFLHSHQKMSLEMIESIVEWAKQGRIDNPQNPVTTFNLLGGEPSLHPQFPQIVQLIARAGFAVHVVTNGGRAFQAQLAKPIKTKHGRTYTLGESGMITYVAISVEGPYSGVHDNVRGTGSFRHAMASIDVLRKRGIPFGLNWTVLASTISYQYEMVSLARRLRAVRLNVHVLSMQGTARERASDQTASPDQWQHLWDTLRHEAHIEAHRPAGQPGKLQIDCEASFLPNRPALGLRAEMKQRVRQLIPTGLCNVRQPEGITIYPDGSAIVCPLQAENPELSGYVWVQTKDPGSRSLYRRNDPRDEIAKVTAAGDCDGCPLFKGKTADGNLILCVLTRLQTSLR